jgi:ribonuclease D
MLPVNAPELITDADRLAERCAGWAREPWLALDTEFLREDTYYPKLCLIQVGDGRDEACIDPLAMRPEALAPLWAISRDPAVLKLFHAASQDLEIFVRLSEAATAPLADTQIAASLLGLGDQMGYAALVKLRLGIELDKSLTRTDWSRRPLRPAELDYAAADVRHLATIWPSLLDELRAAGRQEWFDEDCARLADPARYRPLPEDAWQRLKGLARLAPEAQAVAAALAIWRERIAQARDRPRKWILDDEPLYRIAERRPRSVGELAALAVLPPKTLERHGEALVAVIAEAGGTPGTVLVEELLSEVEKARIKRLQAELLTLAKALNVSVTVLAPRADLEALARHGGEASAQVLRGWRREVAGERLLKVL